MSVIHRNQSDLSLLARVVVFLSLLVFLVLLVYFRHQADFEFYHCEAKFDLIKIQTDYLVQHSSVSAQLLKNDDWSEFWQDNTIIGEK